MGHGHCEIAGCGMDDASNTFLFLPRKKKCGVIPPPFECSLLSSVLLFCLLELVPSEAPVSCAWLSRVELPGVLRLLCCVFCVCSLFSFWSVLSFECLWSSGILEVLFAELVLRAAVQQYRT